MLIQGKGRHAVGGFEQSGKGLRGNGIGGGGSGEWRMRRCSRLASAGTAAKELTGILAASTIQAPKPDASAFLFLIPLWALSLRFLRVARDSSRSFAGAHLWRAKTAHDLRSDPTVRWPSYCNTRFVLGRMSS